MAKMTIDDTSLDSSLTAIAEGIRDVANTLENFSSFQGERFTPAEMAQALTEMAEILEEMDGNNVAY